MNLWKGMWISKKLKFCNATNKNKMKIVLIG